MFHDKKCNACYRKWIKTQRQMGQKGGNTQGNANTISALDGNVNEITFKPKQSADVLLAFKELEQSLLAALKDALAKHKGIKWKLTMRVRFSRIGSDEEEIETESQFLTVFFISTNDLEIEEQLSMAFHDLFERCETFTQNGSGWIVIEVIGLSLKIVVYKPLAGRSYLPLPSSIEKKHAVINVQNDDEKCFYWSILSALYPAPQNAQRVTKYQGIQHNLDFSQINYPTTLRDIAVFERNNKNVTVSVFGLDENEKVYPLRVAKQEAEHHIDLLFFCKGDIYHFCWIKSMSRLLSSDRGHDGSVIYCKFCLNPQYSEESFKEHVGLCCKFGAQKTTMPKKGVDDTMKFSKLKARCEADFLIVADIESYVTPISTCQSDPTKSSTTKYAHHTPCSFGYKLISTCEKYTKDVYIYTGEDPMEHFIDRMIYECHYVLDIIHNQEQPLNLTPEQEKDFQNATHCWICHEKFAPYETKVKYKLLP